MNSKSQLQFDKKLFRNRLEFGGALLTKAKNRTARPISSRDTMHVVLKSTRAVGRFSFGYRNHPMLIQAILRKQGSKFGVKLVSSSNNFNHLHLHLKFLSRAIYVRFIRSITASIAVAVTGASKLRKLNTILGARFWDRRPFTRVIQGLRNFKRLEDYVRLNQLEAAGILPKRDGRLRAVEEHERRYF